MTISDETVEKVASSRFGSKLGWAHAGEAFKAAALEQARRELEAGLPAWVASAAPDTIIGKLRDDERQAMTSPVIPAEAVEAAAKAMRPTVEAMQPAFEKADMQLVVDLDHVARIILEAAAPYMLAGAWDEGYDGAVDAFDGRNVSNPYRAPDAR